MSDYYMVQPTCPNCGVRYTDDRDNLIYVKDDPEIGDSHFICKKCGKTIRVHAHMEFDYTIDEDIEELPF